jgi:hypothetical protein
VAITLAGIAFDEVHTTAQEKLEEVGGRDQRVVEVAGLVVGEPSEPDVEARLDAILAAASAEDYGAALSLRPGRRLWVRREAFTREVSGEPLAAAFTLTLRACTPFEESTSETTDGWSITASGATKALDTTGTMYSLPALRLVAAGGVVNPSFSDGQRTLGYSGVVADGSELVLDGPAGIVTLDGEDVTPYSEGAFPRIEPGGTTFTYTDDTASSHTAAVTIALRDRWW